MKYYSPTTKGFYSDEVNGNNTPSDVFEVSETDYDLLMEGQSNGLIIHYDGTKLVSILADSLLSSEERLANAKTAKLQELETAFITTSKLPVTVGAKTYNGGKESAQALRDYIQLVTESGGTSFTIWDSSNAISTYTLADATAMKLAVATAVAQGEFNLRTKKNAVNDATTITAVSAVVW